MKKQGFSAFLLPVLLAGLLFFSNSVKEGVRSGLLLSYEAVLPALFPAMVLCGMIGELAEYLPLPVGATLWITAQLCGFPLGARTLATAYRRGLISRQAAMRLSACCSNASPAFLIAYAGESVLGSRAAGLWLFAGQLTISGILALWLGVFEGKRAPQCTDRPLFPIFTGSIAAAAQGALVLTGYITAFAVVGRLCAPLPGYSCFYGLLELTGGLAALRPGAGRFWLAAAITGFSGWSVMLQNGAYLVEADLPLKPMLLGKLLYLPGVPAAIFLWQKAPLAPVFLICLISFDKWKRMRYNKRNPRKERRHDLLNQY